MQHTDENCPPLEPNAMLGILGGGQLGRLLGLAAARLGLKVHVFCPDEHAPAFDIASAQTVASYTDQEALERFARSVDRVTYEFENVPAETVAILESAGAQVAPGKKALSIAQDRLAEKMFVAEIGGATCAYHTVDSVDDLALGLRTIGRPAILKTRRFGYDGKGQTRIDPATEEEAENLDSVWQGAIDHAWAEIGARPAILEAFVPFSCEISVIAARDADGSIVAYDPPRNDHGGGILRRSTVPAGVSVETQDRAFDITRKMLDALDYVGVIGVEFFVLQDGSVLVNEFAPRVHNSGHWTDAACTISQFEMHVRAVCGWPLLPPHRHADAVMENLIGDEVSDMPLGMNEAGVLLTLYGKDVPRPGRKMGHRTRVSPRPETP